MNELIESEINKPFDLTTDHMLRGRLVKLNEEDHVLILITHHIASDGWSLSISVRELIELYASKKENRLSELSELSIQYADYAIWQHKYLEGEVLNGQMAYWKNKLTGVTPVNLPIDYPRPAVQSTKGRTLSFTIGKQIKDQLQELSQREGTTLYMTLLSAFKILLYRYTGQEDICVGTAIANRKQKEVEDLIGFFVNSLALRSDLSGNPGFKEVLARIKAVTLDAYSHQDAPFEKVVEQHEKERDLSRHPIFQIMFALQNTPDIPELSLGNVAMAVEPQEYGRSKFDLFFEVTEGENELGIRMEYCTDLFAESTIRRMNDHYQQLLVSVVANPSQGIDKLQMLTKAEEEQLITGFNNTRVAYPKNNTVNQLFEQICQHTPDAVAMVIEGEKVTYRVINEKANQLGHYLKSHYNLPEEAAIGLLVDRSERWIVSLLAILKCGGVYVPIDPSYPADRISYIVEETKPHLLLLESKHTQVAEIFTGEKLCVDVLSMDYESKANLPNNIGSDSLAYIMFTSGSTGKPKGVMVSHKNIIRLVQNSSFVNWSLPFRLIPTGAISFDATTFEIWGTLLNGGELHLLSQEQLLNCDVLKEYIAAKGITTMWFTASWFNQLVDEDVELFRPLKQVLAGGERLSPVHVNKVRKNIPSIKVINGYGPTENTTFSICYTIEEEHNDAIPLGYPISNSSVYILNKAGDPVPVGVEGELYLGGDGLSRGYLNRPELTEEKFIVNPFDPATRLYRTGDWGKWLPDGKVAFSGRKDDQVKIRGYRIELGEIENQIGQFEGVSDNVVLVQEDPVSGKSLVSFYIPDEGLLRDKEEELYRRQVENWKDMYEEKVYLDQEGLVNHQFDITGWLDSFTGKGIPAEQMREWLADITRFIMKCEPKRVLEIGSGTGLIYYQLIDHLDKYIGCDFSRTSIERLSAYIQKEPHNSEKTTLINCAADQVKLSENEEIDTIILNSIIQYFPGETYLLKVISNCISFLKGKGKIIMGDIRDYRLLESFKSRLNLDKMSKSLSMEEFSWEMSNEALNDNELCISPEFFYNLNNLHPEISHIDIEFKQGTHINEMSLYRYNVAIYVGIERATESADWIDWDTHAGKIDLKEMMNKNTNIIGIKNILNPRLRNEAAMSKAVRDDKQNTIEEAMVYFSDVPEESFISEEIYEYAKSLGYSYRLLVNQDPFKWNIVWSKDTFNNYIMNDYQMQPQQVKDFSYINFPLFKEATLELEREIRRNLVMLLPAYMVPGKYIPIGKIPLTTNGKANRRFLSQHENKKRWNGNSYQAPVNELEVKMAEIWSDLLNIDKIGVNDNFFELGGHSLLVVKLQKKLSEILPVQLTLAQIFDNPTIARLCILAGKDEAQDPVIHFESELLTFEDVAGIKGDLPETFMENVLITGVTGFLGSFILSELLTITQAQVYCLVKCNDAKHGILRISDSLGKYGLWKDHYELRIKVVKGDLSAPKLGIESGMYNDLVQKIDTVIHNATYMNHLSTYQDAKRINVDGAKEVIKFALEKTRKAIHYISTAGVFGNSKVQRNLDELSSIKEEIHHNASGYTSSKWVAENIFSDAGKFGIPINIYRPGLMLPSIDGNFIDEKQWLSLLLETCRLTNLYPSSDDIRYGMPVDRSARTLVLLAQNETDFGRTVHLWDNEPYPLQELIRAFFGSKIELMQSIPALDFYTKIADEDLPLSPLLSLYQKEFESMKDSEVSIFSSKYSEDHFKIFVI